MTLLVAPSPALALSIEPKQELGFGLEPGIAATGGNVYAVWRSLDGAVCSGGACFNDVFLRSSADAGNNFGALLNLSADPDSSHDPVVAASGTQVYVAWKTSDPATGASDVAFRSSANAAATFAATVNVSQTGAAEYPQVAATGLNSYVVWWDWSLGNAEVFFRRSTDGGFTLDAVKNLSANLSNGSPPSIVLDGGSIYVIWGEGGQLRIRQSADGGATFSPTSTIAAPANARLAFVGNSVHATWMQQVDRSKRIPANVEVFYARSQDGGSTFGTAVNLSNSAIQSRYPDVAANPSRVIVAWQDDASTSRVTDREAELFVRQSADKGSTFEAAAKATDSAYYFIDNVSHRGSFDLALSGDAVYAIWFEQAPDNPFSVRGFKVYFSRGS